MNIYRWFKFTLKPPYTIPIGNWQFGILPYGLFFLKFYGHFWDSSIFDSFRVIWVLFRKWVPSENQRYLNNGVLGPPYLDLGAGGQASRWANIFGAVIHLSGHCGPLDLKVQFGHIRGPLKGNLAFTYFTKNQSIGVPWYALDDLFWNFEWAVWQAVKWQFFKNKSVQLLSHIGYEEFWPVNRYKGVK